MENRIAGAIGNVAASINIAHTFLVKIVQGRHRATVGVTVCQVKIARATTVMGTVYAQMGGVLERNKGSKMATKVSKVSCYIEATRRLYYNVSIPRFRWFH